MSSAIGPKVANLIQYISTFGCAYGFAFYRSWRLTLVMLGALPVLMLAGAVVTKVVGAATEKAQRAYAVAGGVAQDVLSSIRTVQAFDAMEHECRRYDAQIDVTERVGIRKGFYVGISIGTTMFILFGSYALAFWYGSWLVCGLLVMICEAHMYPIVRTPTDTWPFPRFPAPDTTFSIRQEWEAPISFQTLRNNSKMGRATTVIPGKFGARTR